MIRRNDGTVTFRAIGYVELEDGETLAQGENHRGESLIVLNPDLKSGLKGLVEGQEIMVVFHFHDSRSYDLRQHPRGDKNRPKRGVFALRSPRRPNPIGVTLVTLIAKENNILRVRGLDAYDGTPILDIKPA